jgi:hypothetical protein
MWNSYGAHGIALVSSIANVRAALSLPDDALTSVAKVKLDAVRAVEWLWELTQPGIGGNQPGGMPSSCQRTL